MNEDRFDDLTRKLARHTARQRILKTAVWGAVAMLAGALRLGGAHAADFSALICYQQNHVSYAGECCPLNATCSSGTSVCPPGTVLWNGGISTSWSNDRVPNPGNGQPRYDGPSHAAPLRYPARTGHVQSLYHRSHPPRSTQAGPHSALVIRRSGPGTACLIGRRVREAGAPIGPRALWPQRTRGPPPSSARG